jgi:hypothetical protein
MKRMRFSQGHSKPRSGVAIADRAVAASDTEPTFDEVDRLAKARAMTVEFRSRAATNLTRRFHDQ